MAIFVPELFADAVLEKMDTTLRFGSLATNFEDLVKDIRNEGDKISFPKFVRNASYKEHSKGDTAVPTEIDMTNSEAVIKHVVSAYRVHDKDSAQIKGAVKSNMIKQTIDIMAKAIDESLVESINTEVVHKFATASGTDITNEELNGAMDIFGDDQDTDTFAGIVLNSRLRSKLVAMPEFTSTGFTYQTDGNGLVTNGLIGYFLGIPVYICNLGTWDSGTSETITYLIKKDAIGYIFQKNIGIEEEREAKMQATDIIASSLFATKLLDDEGVVVLRKTV